MFREFEKALQFVQSIKFDYTYTAGVAGERFLKELKERGRIVGSVCEKCGSKYVPPKSYCEDCFSSISSYRYVPEVGTVYSYTISYTDLEGKRVERPQVYILVRFEGFKGGLLHKLGNVKAESVRIGMKVRPVFKRSEARKGSILDIDYFEQVT